MAKSSAERVALYRARRKAEGEPDSSRAHREEHAMRRVEMIREHGTQKPFTGCDGEGAGTDDKGRQLYLLFRMGDRELYAEGHHLRTEEILDHICGHGKDEILVGFAFGYDVTMILRDLPESQLRRLLEPKPNFSEGKSRFTWFKEYDLEYLPKQYFRVRRVKIIRTDDGKEIRTPVKNSARTIYETFGFFQMSFLKAITNFDVGTPEQRAMIARNKERRGEFTEMSPEEREYCATECRFLGELMEKLREYCHAASIYPRSWNGAGKLASALHNDHKTITAREVAKHVPAEVQDFANMAYYGGRFEITRTGMIKEKVYEYDIRSAYPDAMRELPCLEHGTWRYARGLELEKARGLFVASLQFNHSDNAHGQLCGFPIRSKEGHLYWPLAGSGVYWSVEIEAAKLLGATVKYREGWIYERHCDCPSFDWIEPLFDYRRSIGSKGPGYPIKLGINSLYGKTAQRKGNGKYANMVHAGLITALTRSKCMSAIAKAPGQIVMVATDAVYSLVPLDVDEGEKLGQWEGEALDGLMIVQPGLYWCPEKRKRKSRGLPGKFFEEPGRTEGFESQWREWNGDLTDIPNSAVPLTNFIGIKLALAWNKPERAGVWSSDVRTISFDFRNKRDGFKWGDGHIITSPKPGGLMTISLPHRDFLKGGGAEPWENARAMLEDMPDYVDLSPPFQD